MARGRNTLKALFVEVVEGLERRRQEPADPPPDVAREFPGHAEPVKAGAWPGAPYNTLPPGCPVVPLGIDGTVAYFIDTAGQLISVDRGEWNKKTLIQLFARYPNYLTWAWPRVAAKTFAINGLEVDDACQCLMKAAEAANLFDPADRVRGRGGWKDDAGGMIWHSGELLWKVVKGKLTASPPTKIDGVFYARRPAIVVPWGTPVPEADNPALSLLKDLATWTWERPGIDPLVLLGWIGCAFLGGALEWRPTIFFTGDRGVGKSKLQAIIKAVLGPAVHATADTTAAGIYQRVKNDSLPVAVDELEADSDNRRVIAVIKLARLAASGAMMYRGGADHKGVDFRAMNAFAFSSINPPPLAPQDRSRMAILNLGRLDPDRIRSRSIVVDADTAGRKILRILMDGWPQFHQVLEEARKDLFEVGLDSRQQDTYGTLLAVARLMLGDAAFDEALPLENLGPLIAEATRLERSEQTENWRGCLEHLLGATVDAWRSGEKPTIGAVLERLEADQMASDTPSSTPLDEARARLAAAGLGVKGKGDVCAGYGLAIPSKGPALARLYAGTPWGAGVWMNALKQAPHDVVLRGAQLGSKAQTKINRVNERCVVVDLQAFDRYAAQEDWAPASEESSAPDA